MRTIDTLADRSLALATRTRDLVAPSATGVRDWVASGAALAIATVVVGAGVLAYGAYRRRKAATAPIGGTAATDADAADTDAAQTPTPRKPRQVATRRVRHVEDAHAGGATQG